MVKSIGIVDKDYTLWLKELVKRYRSSQIKAAIKVNRELLQYYWEFGRDINEKQADNKFFHNLWKNCNQTCFLFLGGHHLDIL